MTCHLTPTTGGVIVRTPYDAGFVSAFKQQIPNSDRKYDPTGKTWTVSSAYVAKVAHLIERHFGEKVTIPQIAKSNHSVMRLLDVRYIGGCKDRQDGTITAFGWSGGQWSVIFPEAVLRAWFEAPTSETVNTSTLYSVLGARPGMTADELKTAYRRCALQWHPDRCKDLEAGEIFLKVQHAWEVLSSPRLRERYDAGLALEASLGKQPRTEFQNMQTFYRSPLKSGLIMCTGKETIGRFIVEKVHEWLDITDGQGRTLVTSWVMGQDSPVEVWA